MQKVQRNQKNEDAEKVVMLVAKLNQYRNEYYNKAKPSVSDAVYDHLFDELQKLEKKTGIILSNSPTQTVGYAPVSALEKVRHPIPLLSLDKTKQTKDLMQMEAKAPALLMLKLDGLTIKLVYENGQLVEASTRGDGDIGEVITHNIPAFYHVPTKIPHKGRLVITGEGFIHKDDFEKMKEGISGKADKEICNARNLASGSIRLLNPAACKERHVYFYAFNILEGMGDFVKIANSRGKLLEAIGELGFVVCPFTFLPEKVTLRKIEDQIGCLKAIAEEGQIPIDGMGLRYDSLSYSESLGRTGHHNKDDIAFKFKDDTYETVFRSIEWEPGRSGEIAPVAVFDTVEIDGCSVSRASLHNLSFIRDLELHLGCRLLVSKRNMIIPHIEDNLDRGRYSRALIPKKFKRSDRGKYAYRVVLYFKDGTKRKKMYSGFATKKEAEDARKFTMGELANGTFIINDNVRLNDFLEYWLEYDIRKRVQSSNTYDSYSNVVHNHINPFMGGKKLTEINKGDVQRLYKDRAGYSKSIARLVKTVMNVSLSHALSYKLINTNPAQGIELPKTVERKPYHTRKIDAAKTLDMDQIRLLLEESKKTPIHMQVLFNVLMGLRRQEINAVKYSDVDYVNRTLSVERQLGKELDRTPHGKSKGMTKCELPLKTPSGRRILPIPDYVFEAILEERKKYEKWRSRRKAVFHDYGYICCSIYSGKPRSKDFHWRHYKGNSSAFRLHCYGIRPFKVCHTAKGRIPLQPLRILTDFAAGAKSWAELLPIKSF